MLTLRGGTLLHLAAEFQSLDAARLLLDFGADANAERRWTKPELAAKHLYSTPRHSGRTLGFRLSNCW